MEGKEREIKLERIIEILKERKFTEDSDLSEEFDVGEFTKIYTKGEEDLDLVDIYCCNGVSSIFISNPCYDFGTDENDRAGINLGVGRRYGLSEDLFIYCLKIQESPEIHERKFLEEYLKFSKWRNEELNPVLNYLEIKESKDPIGIDINNEFPLILSFLYEDDNGLYVELEIDPLTLETLIRLGFNYDKCVDFSMLAGESSDIIMSAIEEFMEHHKQ